MSALPFIIDPKKRKAKESRPPAEMKGMVERVTFHNPENGFCVLRVSDRKRRGTETVVGFALPVSAGLFIHATGRWKSCEEGHQLRAEVIRTELPAEKEDIRKCLGSGLVEGIGPVYAKRFLEAFGEKVFDVLDKHPEKLFCPGGPRAKALRPRRPKLGRPEGRAHRRELPHRSRGLFGTRRKDRQDLRKRDRSDRQRGSLSSRTGPAENRFPLGRHVRKEHRFGRSFGSACSSGDRLRAQRSVDRHRELFPSSGAS